MEHVGHFFILDPIEEIPVYELVGILLVIAHPNTYSVRLTASLNCVTFNIMAKKITGANVKAEGQAKGTSAGRPSPQTKTSSMNKHKKRSFKIYRGQGRP